MNSLNDAPTEVLPVPGKLPPHAATITPAEQSALETFCKAKWAGKQADEFYETVKEIIARIGKWTSEHGVLMPGESTKYSMPTLAQWQARLEEIEASVEMTRTLLARPDLTPEQREKITGQIRATEAQLEQAREYTAHIRSYHETSDWMGEMETFFKAAGIMVQERTANVKFMIVRPSPEKPVKPKGKAKVPVNPSDN